MRRKVSINKKMEIEPEGLVQPGGEGFASDRRVRKACFRVTHLFRRQAKLGFILRITFLHVGYGVLRCHVYLFWLVPDLRVSSARCFTWNTTFSTSKDVYKFSSASNEVIGCGKCWRWIL